MRILTTVCLALCAMSAPASADVLEKIARTNTLTIGFRADAPPFSYISDADEPEGLAVALCRDVARTVKQELALEQITVIYHSVTAQTRFEALESGKIDLLCGPTTNTLSRRKTLDFSIPYFIDGSSVVFRAGEVEGLEDLAGRRVGVLGGTTTEKIVMTLLEERAITAEVITFSTHTDGLGALAEGDVAAYFGDQAILRYQLGRMRPLTPLLFSTEQFSFEPYALTVKRGESEMRLVVDKALSHSFRNGDVYKHINEALGEVTLSDLALSVYQVVALPD